MDKKLWQQVERIDDEAMQIDNLDRKTQLINEKCGDNAEVKEEVLKLLNSMEASGSFWEKMMESNQKLISEIAKDRLESFQSDSIPNQIGSYVIKELIGQGGMGNVYLAEHESKQFNSKVALKIIRREVNQQERIKRFIQERKILSGLNHPNIARLFDGGISEDGRPYFVMEYIEGKPITEYCEINELSIPERLKLFNQACEAVQFAHSNFIVHRDLKPDNVIVTNEGTVKVLDFGIAKLLENEQLTERDTIETRNEHRFLSLNYAAPEQITLEAVTAATDVYTLGLLLYQLLTNKRPFQLHSKTLTEAEVIIRESPPTKPSSAITKTSNLLKGDLDSIVLIAS
jgi:serine/threonine-protein kinase